jgi:hypothetical protein
MNPPCGRCGGPHPFDTSIPSPVWNEVIRPLGISEYLCLTCIVTLFAQAGRSFTAELWGTREATFKGLQIEVRIGGKVAEDAAKLSEENTALRVARAELEASVRAARETIEAVHQALGQRRCAPRSRCSSEGRAADP